MTDMIRFPNLGIVLKHVGQSLTIGSFEIRYYGIIIALSFLAGMLLSSKMAEKEGIRGDTVVDFVLAMVIPAIAGARLYYVIFSWDYYSVHPGEILDIRNGGLAIYGGIIAGAATIFIFCKIKQLSFFRFTDVIVYGLLAGQIIGRWGNFFNREAFGGHTDSLFAMQIPVSYFEKTGRISETLQHGLNSHTFFVKTADGVQEFVQVHPTFLYESLWNLALLLLLLFFIRKHKKFDGEILAVYTLWYGVGRFWIEGLRTDQLQIGSTGIAISQVVASIIALGGGLVLIYRLLLHKNTA